MALQNLRSGVANKRPIPTIMSEGQIALNTNEASPGLFFKDSNGDLVKVGPVHIGTSAPNSSPASTAATALVTGATYQILTVGTSDFTSVGASANTVGTIFTATGTTTGTGTVSGQQGVEKGEQWLDTTGGNYVLKIYDGTAWRSEAGEFVNVSGDTMTGALLLDNAASASAPDLSFDGDANTGVYSPGADQFGVATAGTSRLVIDSSGRLLVGSTSNFADANCDELQVGETGTANTGITIGSSTQGQIAFADSADNRAGVIHYQHTDNSMRFYTAGVTNERLRITSDGKLGVGTSSPDLTLSVNGAVNLRNSTRAGAFEITSDGDLWMGTATTLGNIYFETGHSTTGLPSTGTARMTVNSTGVGIGTTSPSETLEVNSGTGNTPLKLVSTDSAAYIQIEDDATTAANRIGAIGNDIVLHTNGSEKVRLDSSGRLLVGTSSATNQNNASGGSARYPGAVFFNSTTNVNTRYTLQLTGASNAQGGPILGFSKTRSTTDSHTIIQNGDDLGDLQFRGSDGTHYVVGAKILASSDGVPGTNDMPGRLTFWTTADAASSPTERMRITSSNFVNIGTQGTDIIWNQTAVKGVTLGAAGVIQAARNADQLMLLNRITNDGVLVTFAQDGIVEGDISVNGTTVSYNGAHLARWSQLPGGAERSEILRGSVLSNLDEMCEWGEEDNEQLNRMQVSNVEGDRNVAGVFQAWDDDDDTYTNDFYCAMTGDFVIRIAQGTTVARGDLLMSAGDGTAKPQDDDIVRSKTIAKVTSTTVSETYSDGSYCVPCVLMAC